MNETDFDAAFEALTGKQPFPWQRALYRRFISDDKDNIPVRATLPTGLGKTNVIAIWLIALAHGAAVPRRLVYVVNRRTVVDQTTDEVEKYRKAIAEKDELQHLRAWLGERGLALSTLRGQFADNREWSADPSRPAVICGTVDMIGSRLLFSGYGVGMKARPLHAGFLGQDALLVHDEAHLEPAFQRLSEAIRDEQARCKDLRRLRVMELTATSRGQGEVFALTDEDKRHPEVIKRTTAKKVLCLQPLDDPKKLAEKLAAKAKEFEAKNRAVLVFARTVEAVMVIHNKLPKDRIVTLTGTMRGQQRDALVEHALFKRFLPGGQSDEPTSYLVCTSAGEVGVNISADHLVCDLSTFDSMAQRFGRVNRFGARDDTEIHVIHSTDHKDAEYQRRLERTLELLQKLNGDASPAALGRLDPEECQAAFAPEPTILPVTDILFDSWALTTIRDKLPGRPPVEPYLHGIAEWQPPETSVAWREEVEQITGEILDKYPPKELLDEYPLKPHELLRDQSRRVFQELKRLVEKPKANATNVWLLDDDGSVEVMPFRKLIDAREEAIRFKTVILPPSAGGLNSNGMLDGAAPAPQDSSLDVADTAERVRVWNDAPIPDGMHAVLTIRIPGADEDDPEDEWHWCEIHNQGDPAANKPVLWDVHVKDVREKAKDILNGLHLPHDLRQAVEIAAALHDHGKKRKLFQRMLGNTDPNVWLAKSGKKGGRLEAPYRHEFGSLLDASNEPEFQPLSDEQKDLVLHLIAAHHGRARPHFPADETFDPERPDADAQRLAAEVPRRFARLQRKYGRWGLAYLESLLRAADWAASDKPSQFVKDQP